MNVPLLDLMKDKSGYDRTFKRYRISFPMLIRVVEDLTASPAPELPVEDLPGLAHNISLSGIGFVCSEQFVLRDLLEIEITLETQTFPLLARMRWCQALDIPGDPLFHCGAQFERTEAVLQFIPVAAKFLLARGTDRPVRRKIGMIPSVTPDTVPIG